MRDAWGLCNVVFASCKPPCHLALKRAVWCLKIDPVAWPELIREEVFMVTPFRHKRLMGKLFILHPLYQAAHMFCRIRLSHLFAYAGRNLLPELQFYPA